MRGGPPVGAFTFGAGDGLAVVMPCDPLVLTPLAFVPRYLQHHFVNLHRSLILVYGLSLKQSPLSGLRSNGSCRREVCKSTSSRGVARRSASLLVVAASRVVALIVEGGRYMRRRRTLSSSVLPVSVSLTRGLS